MKIYHTFTPCSLPAFHYYCMTLKPDGTSVTERRTVYTTSREDFLTLLNRWVALNLYQWRKGLNFYYYYL